MLNPEYRPGKIKEKPITQFDGFFKEKTIMQMQEESHATEVELLCLESFRFAMFWDQIEVQGRLTKLKITSVHGSNNPLDIEESMTLVRSNLITPLNLFEVDNHGRAVCIFLEHL